MHNFSVFRTTLDIGNVLKKTKASILKTQYRWKNIQHGPEIQYQLAYPQDTYSRYQCKLREDDWCNEFGQLEFSLINISSQN
jgi:hypothetical protein